jgi:hypothetical protein
VATCSACGTENRAGRRFCSQCGAPQSITCGSRERALKLTLAHDLPLGALRAYNNLADGPLQRDRFAEAREQAAPGLALAKARGDRVWEELLSVLIATANLGLVEWDETVALIGGLNARSELARLAALPLIARIQAGRGEREAIMRTLELAVDAVGSTNTEFAPSATVAQAIALNATDRPADALAAAWALATSGADVANEDRREAYAEAGAAAARFAGLLAQRRGDLAAADERLTTATGELRGIQAPFVLGQVLVEHAELLESLGRQKDAGPAREEAQEIFARLKATPWLERAQAARAGAGV